jgi:hypothetical protein
MSKRVLPADVYDALELSALAFGGIGGGDYACGGEPLCVHGHLSAMCGYETWQFAEEATVGYALLNATENDQAVATINRRRGKPAESRVPFDLWCAELGVVRGA